MIHAREDYNRIQDPHKKIPDDEPVFLIRGQDQLAGQVVRMWAELNLLAGGDLSLSSAACEHAERMDAWSPKKLADDSDQAPEPRQPVITFKHFGEPSPLLTQAFIDGMPSVWYATANAGGWCVNPVGKWYKGIEYAEGAIVGEIANRTV